jgi:hypothetical protein
MESAPLTEHDHEELLLLYSSSVSELAAFKQQQWSVTNYTLVVNAALVAAGQIIGDCVRTSERFLLLSLVVISAALGLRVLYLLQCSIRARRDRLTKTREFFGSPFKDSRSVPKENDPVFYILGVAQVVGGLVAAWLIVAWL